MDREPEPSPSRRRSFACAFSSIVARGEGESITVQSVRRIDLAAVGVDDRQRGDALGQRLVTNLRDPVDLLRSFRPCAQPPQMCGPSVDVPTPAVS